ncbi:hypothetical protein [Rhizobium leguminosarum]|uniref:hypothetical protein n=1 Tax=Rhizobium leguminosarum TaxID=384 RepID=UPI003F9C0750
MPPLTLLDSLEQLGRGPVKDVNDFQRSAGFLNFTGLLNAKYAHVKTSIWARFTLATALRRLGLSCLVGGENSELAAPAHEVLDVLEFALCGAPSKRRHLCPLNLASDLPPLSFGTTQLRTFSPAELDALFDVTGLRRVNPEWSVYTGRFAQFNWLVIEEEVIHDPVGIGRRNLPSIFGEFDRDFGRIEPYQTGLTAPVEDALFGLLAIPWEDITHHRETDWRGFHIPWIYSVDTDIFSRRAPVPAPDTLAWEPATQLDAEGFEYESERPITYPLDPEAEDQVAFLNDATWQDIVTARRTALFARPVAHFFIRGFQTGGIDEFLAHIATIEAALGQPEDHDARARRRINSKNPGATYRVARRVTGLLGDKACGQIYEKLFGLRSNFLHGKLMANISGADKTDARALARRVVCGLIGHAVFRRTLVENNC